MSEILEGGDIYFFYHPKVQSASDTDPARVDSIDDIQRFFFIMSPRGRNLYRWVMVGRKRMPKLSGERNWGFVEEIERDAAKL